MCQGKTHNGTVNVEINWKETKEIMLNNRTGTGAEAGSYISYHKRLGSDQNGKGINMVEVVVLFRASQFRPAVEGKKYDQIIFACPKNLASASAFWATRWKNLNRRVRQDTPFRKLSSEGLTRLLRAVESTISSWTTIFVGVDCN